MEFHLLLVSCQEKLSKFLYVLTLSLSHHEVQKLHSLERLIKSSASITKFMIFFSFGKKHRTIRYLVYFRMHFYLSPFLMFSFPFHVLIFVEVLIKRVVVTKNTLLCKHPNCHIISLLLSSDQYHFANESLELMLFYLNEHNTEKKTLYGFTNLFLLRQFLSWVHAGAIYHVFILRT